MLRIIAITHAREHGARGEHVAHLCQIAVAIIEPAGIAAGRNHARQQATARIIEIIELVIIFIRSRYDAPVLRGVINLAHLTVASPPCPALLHRIIRQSGVGAATIGRHINTTRLIVAIHRFAAISRNTHHRAANAVDNTRDGADFTVEAKFPVLSQCALCVVSTRQR